MRLSILAVLSVLFLSCVPIHAIRPLPQDVLTLEHVTLSGEITPENVKQAQDDLMKLRVANKPLVLYINSPGGDAESGMEMHYWLRDGHLGAPVVCVVDGGVAASAAFVILQGCQTRVAVEGSQLLTHEPYVMFGCSWFGRRFYKLSVDELVELAHDMERLRTEVATAVASRMGLSDSEYAERVHGQDWSMTASEAKAERAIDHVLPRREEPLDTHILTIGDIVVTLEEP